MFLFVFNRTFLLINIIGITPRPGSDPCEMINTGKLRLQFPCIDHFAGAGSPMNIVLDEPALPSILLPSRKVEHDGNSLKVACLLDGMDKEA